MALGKSAAIFENVWDMVKRSDWQLHLCLFKFHPHLFFSSEEHEENAGLPTPDPSPTYRPRASAQPESGIKRL